MSSIGEHKAKLWFQQRQGIAPQTERLRSRRITGCAAKRGGSATLKVMRSSRQLVLALSLLLSMLMPTMLCAVPNGRMTPAEHSCCRQMKGQCGGMNMPASHNCCHRDIQAGHVDAVQFKSASYHPTLAVICALPPASSFVHTLVLYQSGKAPEHSPPGSPPSVASVLRI